MSIKIVKGDSAEYAGVADLIVTDPPFEMPGVTLEAILSRQKCDHLVLITTMRQLLQFAAAGEWRLSFDFVLDAVVPKKSMSVRQPNYTHATGAYFTRNGAKSVFNRKLRQRSDTYDGSGYWPTILRAPRERMREFGHAKNVDALADIIGSFEARSVLDPFAGSGTTGMACAELAIDCVLVERDADRAEALANLFSFF